MGFKRILIEESKNSNSGSEKVRQFANKEEKHTQNWNNNGKSTHSHTHKQFRFGSDPYALTHTHRQLDDKHASDMKFKQLRCTIFQEIAYIEIHNSQIE